MAPKKKTKKATKKNPEKSNFAGEIICMFAFGRFKMETSHKCYCLVAGENVLEEKYRRSMLDVAILQDHIGEALSLVLLKIINDVLYFTLRTNKDNL